MTVCECLRVMLGASLHAVNFSLSFLTQIIPYDAKVMMCLSRKSIFGSLSTCFRHMARYQVSKHFKKIYFLPFLCRWINSVISFMGFDIVPL